MGFKTFVVLLLLTGQAWALVKAGPPVAGRWHRLQVPLAGSVSPPLDGVAGSSSGGHGLRKVKGAFAGQAIRLRRASDNSQQDIGFVGNNFDTAAATAFCAATSCFVAKWYDQSGAGRDLVQATAANQPPFVFNCWGSSPCIQLTSVNHLLNGPSVTPATGLVSMNIVLNRAAGTGVCVFSQNGGSGNRITTRTATAGLTVGGLSGSINTTSSDAAWHSDSAVINGASSSIVVDGATTAGTVTGSTGANVVWFSGVASTTCNVTEWMIWDNYALTVAEAAALNANQHTYWGF